MKTQNLRLNAAQAARLKKQARHAAIRAATVSAAAVALIAAALAACTAKPAAPFSDGILHGSDAAPAAEDEETVVFPAQQWAAQQAADEAAYNTLWLDAPAAAADAAVVYEPQP